MHFLSPIPWWLALLVAAAIGALAYAPYRRPLAPLTRSQRSVLTACRALALAIVVLALLRPFVFVPPARAGDAVVAVLVDRSRSMRLSDAGGQARLAAAVDLLKNKLIPDLSKQFRVELFSAGDRVEPANLDRLSADGSKSDLARALSTTGERFRGQSLAAIVLLSDGADTGSPNDGALPGPPVFAIGLGSTAGVRDREIVGMAAAEQRLDQTAIDLRVSATSTGFGRIPFEIRVLANGAEAERRRVVPAADGAPIDEVFSVAPDPMRPTVFTAEIPSDASESIVENNRRSVLVNPPGRRRRLLVIEGAPGFEHSFMTRAWTLDAGLEVDVAGRKGKNAEGHDTFFVQAPLDRTAFLGGGFPPRREDLYAYDALVLANVEGDALTRSQLTSIGEFVSERGGGLLVVGARLLAGRGIAGTRFEDALPLDLSDRANAAAPKPAAASVEALVPNKLAVTADGLAHPVMRIGGTAEETRRQWTAMPALAATVPVGGAKPGAQVLAVAMASTGVSYPVVAVQRYGRGRSMIFAGEASWRWKMLLPSTDRSFDVFWRQAARWVAGDSPDQVTITIPDSPAPDDVPVAVDVRDAAFAVVGNAEVTLNVTGPDGETRSIQPRFGENGHYVGRVQADAPGLYHLVVESSRGGAKLGRAERWMHVGGVDREFVQPRLDEAWLRRIAGASGGRYVSPADASRIAGWLTDLQPRDVAPERRELWHEPWVFILLLALVSVEWMLRRRWGLR